MRRQDVVPLKTAPLYLGFAATGVGVALPGALLPALIERWHLNDAQSGMLFLMSFLGSSVGALLVRGSLRFRLAVGSFAIAGAGVALGSCGGFGAYACMAIYGAGLGMTMTSIVLIRQQGARRAGTELVRLNLLWAAGALICPALTLGALTAGAIEPLLFVLAAGFAALAAWTSLQQEIRLQPAGENAAVPIGALRTLRSVPIPLIGMIVLVTGIEASVGGWLGTYARRGGQSIADVIAAPTFLWGGLLLSRMFWSIDRRRIGEAAIVRGSVALMAAGALLLLVGGDARTTLAAAFCLGLGLGPTYPLLLGWALHFERGGAIFFLAGLGSACLPWLTGVASNLWGSLRSGLAVPAVGCTLMLAAAFLRPLSSWETHETAR